MPSSRSAPEVPNPPSRPAEWHRRLAHWPPCCPPGWRSSARRSALTGSRYTECLRDASLPIPVGDGRKDRSRLTALQHDGRFRLLRDRCLQAHLPAYDRRDLLRRDGRADQGRKTCTISQLPDVATGIGQQPSQHALLRPVREVDDGKIAGRTNHEIGPDDMCDICHVQLLGGPETPLPVCTPECTCCCRLILPATMSALAVTDPWIIRFPPI